MKFFKVKSSRRLEDRDKDRNGGPEETGVFTTDPQLSASRSQSSRSHKGGELETGQYQQSGRRRANWNTGVGEEGGTWKREPPVTKQAPVSRHQESLSKGGHRSQADRHTSEMLRSHSSGARPIMYNVKDYTGKNARSDRHQDQHGDSRRGIVGDRDPPRRPPGGRDIMEDEGIMSEVETSSTGFQRGGRMRASLPVMKGGSAYYTARPQSATSPHHQLGLVFLTYNGETRKTVLPNEISGMEVIRGLFLKVFPHLTFEYVYSSNRRVYILERASGRFFVLVNFRDIKDGTMLKLVDMTSSLAMQRARTAPLPAHSNNTASDSSYYSESERSSPGQPPGHRVHRPSVVRNGSDSFDVSSELDEREGNFERGSKPYSTLPRKWTAGGGRDRDRKDRQHQSKAVYDQYDAITPTNSGYQQRSKSSFASSTPFSQSRVPPLDQGRRDREMDLPPHGYDSMDDIESSSICSSSDPETRERMAKMEAQLANLTAWVQTSRPNSSLSERDGPQSASMSNSSSLSGLSSSTPKQQELSGESKARLDALSSKTREVRQGLGVLKRTHQANMENMKDIFKDATAKLLSVIKTVPGAEEYPVRMKRDEVNEQISSHKRAFGQLEESLQDLEAVVEETRNDLVTRRSLVSVSDVESIAYRLNGITQRTTGVKTGFSQLHATLSSVMKSELEIIVDEDKFLQQEPARVEETITRCRQLSQTVHTLKRLASVQDHRPTLVPMVDGRECSEGDKINLFSSIRAVKPAHFDRVENIKNAEDMIEKRRELRETHREGSAERNLDEANRNLRESENIGTPPKDKAVQDLLEKAKSTDGSTKRSQKQDNGITAVRRRPKKTGNSNNSSPSSRVVMNRDSVNWDEEDEEFIDVTEERVDTGTSPTSAFKPVSKSSSFNGHSNLGTNDTYNSRVHSSTSNGNSHAKYYYNSMNNGKRTHPTNAGRRDGPPLSASSQYQLGRVQLQTRAPVQETSIDDEENESSVGKGLAEGKGPAVSTPVGGSHRMDMENRQRLQGQIDKLQQLRQSQGRHGSNVQPSDGDERQRSLPRQKPAVPKKPVMSKRPVSMGARASVGGDVTSVREASVDYLNEESIKSTTV